MATSTTTLSPNSEQLINAIANEIFEQGKSRDQVISELVSAGGTYSDATIMVDAVINGLRSAFKQRIWTGLAWMAGGIGLTVLTGGVFIFYGAVLYGAYEMIRCTYNGYLKAY